MLLKAASGTELLGEQPPRSDHPFHVVHANGDRLRATPGLRRGARPVILNHWARSLPVVDVSQEPHRDHVIVAGYGLEVCRAVREAGFAYVADANPDNVRAARDSTGRARGVTTEGGAGGAGCMHARLVVLSINDTREPQELAIRIFARPSRNCARCAPSTRWTRIRCRPPAPPRSSRQSPRPAGDRQLLPRGTNRPEDSKDSGADVSLVDPVDNMERGERFDSHAIGGSFVIFVDTPN